VLVTKPHNNTPYELLLGRSPSIGFMRPFGCPVTILNTLDPLGNFDGNADEGFLNTYDDVADAASDVKETENDVYVSTNESDKTNNKKHNEKAKRDDKGKSHVDSLTRVRDLRVKLEEFLLTPLTELMFPSINAVSLKFRIAGKFSFVNPSKYSDDPDIPELEDIVYSDDEEDVSVEADLSNLETNIPVSPIPTTRVHKDHPVNQIISDLHLAPQTRSMTRMVKEQCRLHQINDEDFHTCMFAYFLSQEEPKKVLQALKDTSWIEAMQKELL
nr:putative ribonuclease H-like domain-containing protein [Tanacetum cinerariifolium]